MPEPPPLLHGQGSPSSPQLFSVFAMGSLKMRVSTSFSAGYETAPQEAVGDWARPGDALGAGLLYGVGTRYSLRPGVRVGQPLSL